MAEKKFIDKYTFDERVEIYNKNKEKNQDSILIIIEKHKRSKIAQILKTRLNILYRF